MTQTDALRKGAAALERAGVPDPRREARILWRAAQDEQGFFAKIAERATRRPMAQVLGYRDFYKLRFIVTPDVLDPRPDTETLIEVALQRPFRRVLDLGTGSGCILLSLLDEQPAAVGVGTDVSDPALAVAARNADALDLTARATFVRSDWFDAVKGQFDLIVSNPPYIAAVEMADLQPEVQLFEPRGALTDEADGLSAYRTITQDAARFLTPGGWLIVEIGPTQGTAVTGMMDAAGLASVKVIPDLDGRDRVVMGQNPQ